MVKVLGNFAVWYLIALLLHAIVAFPGVSGVVPDEKLMFFLTGFALGGGGGYNSIVSPYILVHFRAFVFYSLCHIFFFSMRQTFLFFHISHDVFYCINIIILMDG